MATQSQRMWSGTLVAAMASIAACDIAFGLTFQLLPLILDGERIPAWQIGTITAMGPIGILTIGPFLPWMIARLGSSKTAITAILVLIICLLLFKLTPPLWWWFPIRFLFGIAAGTLFTVSETWVLTMSSEATRGRVMGLYSSVLSLTFGIGPTIIPFTGIQGWAPWLIGMGFVALGIVPLLFVKITEFGGGEERGSVIDVVRRQPLIFACALAATLFDAILISFFTIYAIRSGVSLETASTILGIAIIGGVFFYYPMGILADRWSRDGVALGCTVITIITSLLIIPLTQTIFIWPLMVLFCATGFGVYVIALAAIGAAFKGKDMVAASATIAATWGAGGAIGPPIAGKLFDYFGPNAIPLALTGIYIFLMALLTSNGLRILRPSTTELAAKADE